MTTRDNPILRLVVTPDFDAALGRMADESGISREEVIQRAVDLYRVALDARREGKKLLVADDEHERELYI